MTEWDFPANGSPRQKLAFATRYAAMAPRESDLRTWDFRIGDTHLELTVKNATPLEAIDPDGRGSMIGCGAALLYLKLALKHFGCLGRVALFPDLDEPALVARVHFGCCRERDPHEQLLFDAIPRSDAGASRAGGTPVSEMTLAALSQSAAGERGWLDFIQSELSQQRVAELGLAGDQPWTNSEQWRTRPASDATEATDLRWSRRLIAFGGRRMAPRKLVAEPVRHPPVPAATLAVVKTKTDDKHGWVAAGQTMARIVLRAQASGLSWSLSNPMRRRSAREALRVGVGRKGFAQVILSFGSLTVGNRLEGNALQTTHTTPSVRLV